MKTIHIICNPTSGKGSAANALEKIKEWLKFQNNLAAEIHLTENEGHATIIAQDLTNKNQPTTILVLGGDGTVNEVLNGIDNFDLTNLGILPFGSGNDFVKCLKFTKNDPVSMINEYVNNPTIKKIDYMLINDKYKAINSIGLGMSAETIYCRNNMKHFKPKTQYVLATIKCALFWKAFDFEIKVDAKPEEKFKSMWMTIMNGSTIGGTFLIDKNAQPDDGVLNCMYLKPFNHIKTLSVVNKVKKGKIEKVKQRVAFNCKEINIKVNDRPVEYDGCILAHQDNINIKVVPHKINLLVC